MDQAPTSATIVTKEGKTLLLRDQLLRHLRQRNLLPTLPDKIPDLKILELRLLRRTFRGRIPVSGNRGDFDF